MKNEEWVAQATRLCRPATRRTEREERSEPIGMAYLQGQPPQCRSAGRRPERASRPRYRFSKHALSKMSVAFKGARETHFRLRVLAAAEVVAASHLSAILKEAEEVKKVIGVIIVSTKNNLRMGRTRRR